MQMYYNHADCTMVVADSSKITIYNWTPLSITICDIFFNLVQMGQPIYRVQGNTDKFMVTYLNNTKPFRVVYYYDNNIYSLKPFNKILTGIYSSLKQNTIIQLTIDSKLQIRSTNPYNILISYEQFQRTLMITATNTDCTQSTKSISFLIIPVKMNQMYFNKKFYEKQQSYSNQDFSIQLWEIFVSARLTNYTIFIDSQSPFGNNNQSKQISKSIAQNHRMFSLYSLIPCVKMEPYDQQSFIRIMLGPHHTLYIQQCSQQDRLDDYLCTLIDTEQNKIMQDKDDLILLQKKQQTYLWYHKQQNKQDEHQYLVAHQSQCYSITMNSSEFSSHNHIKLIDKDILVLLQTIQQSDKKFHEVITFNMKTKQSFKHCLQNILVKNIDIDIKQMQIVLTVNLIQVGQQNCVIYVIDLNYFIHKLANTKYYKTFTLFKGMYTLSNAPSVASFTKFYKNYYLTINQTSFCKYNKLKVQLQLLYCLDFNNTDQILRGQISNQYLMIVYVQSYRLIDLEASKISAQITYRLQNNAENTIYDLMQLDQNQIIIGIDNIVRSYNLKLEFVVNGFNTRIDVIRQSLNVTIIPIAQVNIQQKLAQKFTLEILYSIQTLEYRGKSIKLLNVPFSAQKYYLEIYQTMFIGSISKYLIFDTFEHQINIINHFQIDQNCFIQLKDQLFLYNYSLLMNDPNIQAPSLLYTNDTSIIIVINNTKKGQVEIEAHPQTIAQRYQHVYHIQQNDQNLKYILVSKSNKIGYIYQRHETGELIFLEYSLNDTLKIIKSSLKVINNENNNNHRICLYLLIHSNTNNSPSLCRQIFFIDVLNKPKEIQQHQTLKLCANAFTIAQNYIIFTKTIISTSKSYYYLCYMNSEYNHNTQCLSLQKIINKKFYIDSIFSYNQIYYLKSSHYERGLQILFVAQRNDAININLQLFIQEQNVKWKISGCYIGLYEQRYKLRNLIKVGKNQGNISYLIVQYSNGFYNKIAYYKFYNYTTQSLYCSQIVNMVAYEPQPNQPYYGVTTLGNKMYNFTQSYFIYEKIYFILNYTSPPPVTYVVIQGLQSQESLQTLGFYSKFIYEVEQKYTILKMSICFGLVILSLIIMRIARQLCDRGIIKWNNSNSTDEDDQVNVSQKILSVDI